MFHRGDHGQPEKQQLLEWLDQLSLPPHTRGLVVVPGSFCLHQAMGRAVATGAAATEITGSAQGSGTSETLSPLMGGDRASRTPLPATLTPAVPRKASPAQAVQTGHHGSSQKGVRALPGVSLVL